MLEVAILYMLKYTVLKFVVFELHILMYDIQFMFNVVLNIIKRKIAIGTNDLPVTIKNIH